MHPFMYEVMVSFVREEHVFEEISTGRGKETPLLVRIFHTQNLSLIECLGMAGSDMADCSEAFTARKG